MRRDTWRNNRMKNFLVWLAPLALVSALVLSGCSARHTIAENKAPEWVNKGGSWVMQKSGKKMFAGVGFCSGIKNKSLAVETADNRARSEISKIFGTFSATILNDYQNSSGEQNISRSQSTVSESSLMGVLIAERWVDPKTGTVYSLAELDLNWVLENLGSMNIDAGLKDFVRKQAQS